MRYRRLYLWWKTIIHLVSSLQCKLTVVMLILIFVVTAAASGYLLHSSGRIAVADHERHLVHLSNALSRTVAAKWPEGKFQEAKTLATEVADGHPLLYFFITDTEGRELASASIVDAKDLKVLGDEVLDKTMSPGQPVVRVDKNGMPILVDVMVPILRDSLTRSDNPFNPSRRQQNLAGYLRTGVRASGWHRMMATRLDLMVGIGILATALVVPIGFMMIRRIVSPLESLAGTMLRFSQGKLDVRSSIRRRDEVGRLAASFNRMADQHQHTHDRILRLNEDLEKRVALRTQQLRELASRDPLTSLFNRRHFNEMLERRLAEATRYKTDLACIMIDLDGFKAVNDSSGHHVGDELLQVTADTIMAQLRTSDVAARFGGDEFIALLPQTDADQAKHLAHRIMEQFNRTVKEKFPDVNVSMSVGVAGMAEADIGDAEALVRTADHAMYEAKGGGKNRIVTADAAWNPAVT